MHLVAIPSYALMLSLRQFIMTVTCTTVTEVVLHGMFVHIVKVKMA